MGQRVQVSMSRAICKESAALVYLTHTFPIRFRVICQNHIVALVDIVYLTRFPFPDWLVDIGLHSSVLAGMIGVCKVLTLICYHYGHLSWFADSLSNEVTHLCFANRELLQTATLILLHFPRQTKINPFHFAPPM